jgi:hypothetical protein
MVIEETLKSEDDMLKCVVMRLKVGNTFTVVE